MGSVKSKSNDLSNMAFGRAFKFLREAKGLQLGEVAESAGISKPFLSLVEQGKRQPSVAVISKLATALKIPTDVLFLLSTNDETSLKTDNEWIGQLAKSLKSLVKAERELKQRLDSRGAK